jgi:hypothetical protein
MNKRELKLERQLTEMQIGGAKAIHALDCAIQLVEALIAYLPDGTVLPEGVSTAKRALDHAMKELRK